MWYLHAHDHIYEQHKHITKHGLIVLQKKTFYSVLEIRSFLSLYDNNTNMTFYFFNSCNYHSQYTCCGVHNGTDWLIADQWERNTTVLLTNGSYTSTTLIVPVSCCRLLTRGQLQTKWFGQILSKRGNHFSNGKSRSTFKV